MKLNYLVATVAASALLGGAAYAQDTSQQPAAPPATVSGSVTTSTDSTVPSTDATVSTTTTTTATTAPAGTTATSATDAATGASVTTTMVSNGPVPDTAENRAKYGGPMSHAGKRTAAKGN